VTQPGILHADLVIDFGVTFRRQLHYVPPWDLTGCTVILSILSRRSCPITYELAVDFASNMIDLHFTPEQTTQLRRFKNHRFYIDFLYPSGDKIRVIRGLVKENV
jgi:hypothetical protein